MSPPIFVGIELDTALPSYCKYEVFFLESLLTWLEVTKGFVLV
jgi:hypothetical protein